MTNEQFWKKLDKIASKKQTPERTKEFLEVLKQGCRQQLDILVLGIENENNTFNQNCAIHDNKKIMLYFTSKQRAKDSKFTLPAIFAVKPECIQVSCVAVIKNAFKKDEVEAIAFNYESKYPYIIPKMFLLFSFMADADKFGLFEE